MALSESLYVDDQSRIERLVLDPAAPVHVAARIAHNSARTDAIVELLMGVTVDPEHRHIEEGIWKLGDEGARGPIIGVALR